MDFQEHLLLESMALQGMESAESKKSKLGVTILKDVIKNMKLDPLLVTENNQILHAFLEDFITKMKYTDDLFKFLYSHIFYTGSFYSDLRISKPDEFDINLILKFPSKDFDFEVSHQFQAPSYVKYYLKNHEAAAERYPTLMKTLFENGFLIPEKVRNWIQSVVDRARNGYQCRPGITILPKSSGPARTIILKKRNGHIDIDLVPVIACNLDLPRGNLDGRVSAIVGSTLKTFLVPKPFSAVSRQMPMNQKEMRLLWRSHFPEAEERMIHDLGCAKPVIKLLKRLRDYEDWKSLASYYLKTIVMWMIIENKNTKRDEANYWKEDKMDERFIDALKKLSTAVGQKKIAYLFNKKHNLIEKMNIQQAQNIHNRINFLVRKIEDDRYYLKNVYRL